MFSIDHVTFSIPGLSWKARYYTVQMANLTVCVKMSTFNKINGWLSLKMGSFSSYKKLIQIWQNNLHQTSGLMFSSFELCTNLACRKSGLCDVTAYGPWVQQIYCWVVNGDGLEDWSKSDKRKPPDPLLTIILASQDKVVNHLRPRPDE